MAAEGLVEVSEIADKVHAALRAKQESAPLPILEMISFATLEGVSKSALIGVTQFRIMIERALDALDGFDG